MPFILSLLCPKLCRPAPRVLRCRAVLLLAAFCCIAWTATPIPAGAQAAGSAAPGSRKAKRKPPRAPAEVGKLDPSEACPGSRMITSEATFRHYTVRTYRGPNPAGCFEIIRDKHKIFTETGILFQIGGSPDSADDPNALVRMGADVTGDGKPNLVLGHWSGAAGCCYRLEIFEVGSEFRKIAGIDLQRSAGAEFADVDGDGRLELVAEDWTFAEWHAPLADSPAPQVILRFRDGAFHLAADVMRKPAPRYSELMARVQQVLTSRGWENPHDPPSHLWGAMLDLIYSGNAAEAWRFCNAAWPPDREGKEAFLKEFRGQLAKSPYWADLKALQSDSSLDEAS